MAGPNDVILNIGGQLSSDTESKLQQSFSRIEKNMKFNTPFAAGSRSVRDFNSELDRANQRVITLGASFAVLSTSIRVFKDIISSTVAVEKALTDINSVFQLSTKNLEQFSRGLFDVARNTSQSFEKTAEAAKEFSRQGLGATEVLKRTRDAMILTRLASLDTEEAVSTLTAAINGFQKSALDSTQIVNKLATVDAQFAVSSKDLAQGLARAGAAASDAGVSFDQLIGLITAAQQTTARGGAVIGNSLKTIFTRVERKDTIEAFEALGVAVTDLQGNVLPAIGLLQNFANIYDKLGGTVKKQAAELVGGVYQINILKALLSDLSKGSDSIAQKAAQTSANSADEAIKRNQVLNKSLAALAQQAQTTYQQVGSKVGDLGIGNAAKSIVGGFTDNTLIKWMANAGSADTNSMGEKMAAGFIKGFGSAVVFGLGPILVAAMSKVTFSVFSKIQKDFADIIGANRASKDQAIIQEQIVGLYNAGDSALKRQLLTMGSLVERAAMVETILSRSAARQTAVGADISSLAGAVANIRKTPRAASGYDPFSAEASAIRAGVGGASAGAKPVMIPNFAFGGGVTGPIVANTSEWMVKKSGGSSIYNPAMIQKMGLPPGATPIAAGGYIPNMAEGEIFDTTKPRKSKNPYGLPPEWGSADYYKNTGAGSAKAPSYPFGIPPGAPYVSSSPVTGSASGQGIGQFITSIEHLGTQLPASLKKALDTFNVNLQTMALGKVTPYGPNVPPTFLANQALGGTSVPLSHGPAAPTEKQLAKMEKDKSEFLKKAFEKSKAEDDLRSADFAKSQKELNKQHALDVKASELKQKQLDEMAEQLDNKKKITSFSDSELRQQERVNDMLRKAESINMEYAKEALLPIVHKTQAKEAKFASYGASPETMSEFLATRAASAGSGADYDAQLQRRPGASRPPPPTPPKYTTPHFERTYPEEYFKRDFKNLRLTDLSAASSTPLPWMAGTEASRYETSQIARRSSQRGILQQNGSNYGLRLDNALTAAKALAGGQDIEQQFNKTVQDAIKAGSGITEAYKSAITQIATETNSRKKINEIIGRSIPINTEFEKNLIEENALRIRSIQIATVKNRASVTLQATQNQIGATLGSGGFGALDSRQRAIYLATIRREEAQKLGFANSNVGQNTLAQSQINSAVAARMSNIFQTIPDTLKGSEKSGLFSRLLSGAKNNPLVTSLGTSMGLSFAGGAVPSMFSESAQRGGTGSGMAIGGLGSALTLAGTGAGLGSFGGLPGMAIGASIGAAIGGISGILGKMTKSFEELASEINNANEKIRVQFDNASEVARTQAQITELLSSDQSPDEIQKGARRLREQVNIGLSKIENPRIKSLMESGSDKDVKEALGILTKSREEKTQGQDIISAIKGALDTSVGNMGGAFGYKEDSSERISKALSPFFANKTGPELAGYSRSAQANPSEAIRKILKESGIDEKTIEESLPRTRLNLLGADGYENTGELYRGGIAKAISSAISERSRRPEVLKRQEQRAKQMTGLRALSERYKGESEFAQIRSASDLQISGVQQQITLASPLLTDTERLKQQGAFGVQNIRAQSAGAREAQLLAGKSSLSDLLSKGGDSDQIRKLIDGLSGLGDIKNLIEIFSSPDKILAAGVSGVATPEFKKSIMDLQRSIEKLDESENEQIRVTSTTNKLLSDQLTFTKTYAGARAEYGGAAKSAGINLATSLRRFDTPDILSKAMAEADLAGLNEEYNARAKVAIPSGRRGFSIDPIGTASQFIRYGGKGPMSAGEYYGRRIGSATSAGAAGQISEAAGIRYLLNNPEAKGAKDLKGDQVTSSLLSEASVTGMSGKSIKSMGDGFTAVFAGMKKDITDLSKLGANLGQSLSSNLSGAFGDFVTGAKSGKDAFRSFAVSVLGDASRMFASQAIQGILGSVFGGISPTIGRANGGPIPFAAGGKVPAMLTGGEYYIGPKAAKSIGYDTLHRLNKYADGGIVRGGSGVKDDVPARLAPGSFIIKKSAVGKLGPDYLDSLVNGKVQHRFFGGLLMGAVMGGALGYATGGKKGALIGAIGGGIAGGLAQNFAQTGHLLKAEAGASMFQFSPSAAASGPTLQVGTSGTGMDSSAVRNLDPAKLNVNDLVTKAPMPIWQKAAIGLGASALLGGVSSMLAPKDPKFTPMNATEISANRVKLEAEQRGMTPPSGLFPWLSANPNGGFNQMGYVLPPTRRMYANGGMVDFESPGFFEDGGEVKVQSPRLFANSGKVAPQSPRVFADTGKTGFQSPRVLTNSGKPAFQSPLAFVTKETVDPRPFVTFANSEKADFQSPRLFANGGMVDSQPSVAFEDGGKVDFKSPALFMDGGKVGFQPSVPFANGGKVDFQSPRLFANGGTVDFQSPRILTNDGKADFKPTRVFADGGKVDFESPRLFANGGMVNIQPPRLFANGGPVDFQSSRLFADTATTSSRPSRLFANGGEVDFESPRLFADGGMVGGGSVEMATPMTAPSGGGGGSSNVSVKIEINNNGTSSATASSDKKDGQGSFGPDFAMKLQKQVQGIVQQELVNQSRSDGFFAQKSRFVQGR